MDAIFYPLKGEKLLCGKTGIVCRAIALWRNETSDRKHGGNRKLSSSFTGYHSEVLKPLHVLLFPVEFSGGTCEIKTVDNLSCATLLKKPICTFFTKQKMAHF